MSNKNIMKKVLFTATVDSHILHFHIPYLKMFKENGYEVHVATNGDEEIPYCDVKHKISFERNPIKVNNLRAIAQLKNIIEDEKFDIIHTHTPMGSVVTRLAAKKIRRNGTRVIYTAHGFHFFKGAPIINWLVFYPIEKYLSKYTDCLITINQEDYNLAKKKFKAKQTELIQGVGVNENRFNFEMADAEKYEFRKSLGLKEDDFVIIYVAELSKRKNQGMLIKATKKLIDEGKNIKVLLTGTDSMNGYYQQLVKKLNIEDNIKFLGYRKDIPKLLKISDLYVSTAKQEGLPVNIMEAMFCGLPIIATDCRGNRDLIKSPIQLNGLDELKKKIIEIYGQKERYYYDISNYLEHNIMQKMKQIYNNVSKKKVMHILSSNTYSGAENVACTIIVNTNKDYDEVYCSPNGEIKEELKKLHIPFLPLEKMKYKELKRRIREFKPDIIHAHDFKASCYSALFYQKSVVISHIHGNNKKMNSLNCKSLIYFLLMKRFKKIIWVSDSSLEEFYFYDKIEKSSLVLYNVIDTEQVREKSEEYECNKSFDLIYLGRLAYPKNPERLIEIVRQLKKGKNDISLAIVGDGIEREKIEELTNKFQLNQNITYYGFKSNPFPILKSAKILIMTSIYEGTPMSVLEAQTLSLPVISTPVDGLRKIIKNNYNGFLSDDNSELVNKILEILNNDILYEKMKKNSFLDSQKRNNLEKYLKQIEKIYTNEI